MKVLIWSNEHNGWWRKNYSGYTANYKEAGKYPLGKALNICREANEHINFKDSGKVVPPNETIFPLESQE